MEMDVVYPYIIYVNKYVKLYVVDVFACVCDWYFHGQE